MTQKQAIRLKDVFQIIIDRLYLLQFAEYAKANSLCGEARQAIEDNLIPKFINDWSELKQIDFYSIRGDLTLWNELLAKVLYVCKKIRDYANDKIKSFSNTNFNTRTLLGLLFLIIASTILWLSPSLFSLVWLSNNRNRLLILIIAQILLILISFVIAKPSVWNKLLAFIIALLSALIGLLKYSS